jgi:hypothetical protein
VGGSFCWTFSSRFALRPQAKETKISATDASGAKMTSIPILCGPQIPGMLRLYYLLEGYASKSRVWTVEVPQNAFEFGLNTQNSENTRILWDTFGSFSMSLGDELSPRRQTVKSTCTRRRYIGHFGILSYHWKSNLGCKILENTKTPYFDYIGRFVAAWQVTGHVLKLANPTIPV